MPDGRHLDVVATAPLRRADVFTCDEPVGTEYATICECQECGEYTPTKALIWCLDGRARCVACAMRWRPDGG